MELAVPVGQEPVVVGELADALAQLVQELTEGPSL